MVDLNPETEVHRTAKFFMDSGEAQSLEAAEGKLRDAAIAIGVGPDIRHKHNVQAALMTAVNAGARTFLGGVYVHGPLSDSRLSADIPGPRLIAESVLFYGGRVNEEPPSEVPYLLIGDAEPPQDWRGPVIRITWKQWCACVTSDVVHGRLDDDDAFPPAAIHAAAKALAECFQFYFLKNPMATRRTWITSLYRPDFVQNPLDMAGPDEALLLPTKLWLIGLGHLGQAYLWNLLWLRYPLTDRPELVLQDMDVISKATLSTGMLAFHPFLNKLKTRVMCQFLEDAGYKIHLIEKRFDQYIKVNSDEPRRALSGLDNPEDRSVLDLVDFQEVIDAGLGSSNSAFMTYQIQVFPGLKLAGEIFKRDSHIQGAQGNLDRLREQPAYQELETKLGCGMVAVAQKAVGAPFVGTAVASLVIAEAVRGSMPGSPRYHGMSGSMTGPESLNPVARFDAPDANLGYVKSL